MRVALLLSFFLCACSPKIVYIPTPVDYPRVIMPLEPAYPALTPDATPRQTMQYFLLKDTMQAGYIKQLKTLLAPYTK